MRIHRLSLVVLALLLSGCGRMPDQIAKTPVSDEVVQAARVTPVSSAAQRALSAPMRPALDNLPPLPFGDATLRHGSVVQTAARNGSASFAAGGGATNSGTSKVLSAVAGSMSWAVYQLPGLPANARLQKLNVNVSSGSFSGNAPGFWVGLADFSTNSWTVLARSQADYQRVLSGASGTYISDAGNMYVFVLVTDGQSVTVDNVSLTYDSTPTSGWTAVTLESGLDDAWTPAIALDYYGSPWLVWSDHSAGTARYAWGNATVDLSVPGNWLVDGIPNGVSGLAEYTDITIDQRSGLPVASVNYVGQSQDANNSQAGMDVFQIGPQDQPEWFSFTFGKMDGARDTSIDYDPVSHFFGIATEAQNANTPANQPDDIYVRYIDLGALGNPNDNVIKVSSAFGADLFFPHLRFNPAAQRTRMVARGAQLFSNLLAPADTPDWKRFDEAANTGPFGSLAYNPDATGPRFGITYAKDIDGKHKLFYNSYASEEALADVEEVDSSDVAGNGEWLGACSQLAYMWDGTPLVAYTVKSAGGGVSVKLARRGAGGWTSETVSTAESGAGSTPLDVQVDLGVEPEQMATDFTHTGRVFVVWNELGATNKVQIAYKVIQ